LEEFNENGETMNNAIPPSIQKPSRYSGSEVRRPLLPWSAASVRFVLAFPDVYEIGMSHLGIHILYDVINGRPGTLCERCFAPWTDMERHLRESGAPLVSLESGRPVRDFDVLGFSLCYDLTYTNVLQMLDLAGIPLASRDRGERDPLVIGGGVCTLNPAPVAPFFDAFLIGDGEEAVLEIAARVQERKRERGGRAALLRDLAGIEGVFVPGVSPKAVRRVLRDLERCPLPEDPILPAMRIVHDRLSVEISRGCTRGCRFCQAGYVYRPVRERDPAALRDFLADAAPATGYDEVGLLSLSAADYGCIDRLVAEAMDALEPERISLSLPSLRLDALREDTVRQIRKVRKSGFTLAPEAGTERLRRAVNKDIRDEDILRSADWIFGNGWQALKLYFMVGLPGETAADVRAIGELARQVAAVARRHGKRNTVTVSVSAFVPKPHTPFQWERQIGREETVERIGLIRSAVGRDRNVDLKYHSPEVSELEGVFSRGDGRLAEAILGAYRLGARFDAWTETFRPDAWSRAFADAGIDPREYLAERDPARPLPWDMIDARIARAFLLAERKKSQEGLPTSDCRADRCAGCGVCAAGLANVTFAASTTGSGNTPDAGPPSLPAATAKQGRRSPAGTCWSPDARHVLRIRYAKEGPARFLSTLEIQSLWGRVLRRAGLPLAYSRGFNPAPRLSLSPALPVGTESRAEFLEAELVLPVTAQQAAERLSRHLPRGVAVEEVRFVPPGALRLSDFDLRCTYRIAPVPPHLPPPELSPERVDAAWRTFAASEAFPMTAARDGREIHIDLKPLVSRMEMNGNGLFITIIHGTGRGARPLDAAAALLGFPLPPGRFAPAKVAAEFVPRRKG
jgi:radical SAM-linked protein